jgi:hypothetical protein
MSIVQTAPAAWEFQYEVTALIGLAHLQVHGVELMVEPSGGEDVTLILHTNSGSLAVEIQIKSSKEDVDASELATYLAHFPEAQATGNLLARLAKDQSRIALFVIAGRCNDATRGFVANFGRIIPHESPPISRPSLKKLSEAFSKVFQRKKNSNLDTDRLTFCQEQAKALRTNTATALNVLRRVLIWEQVKKGGLEQEIENQLCQKYLVPRNLCHAARIKLVEGIKSARDEIVDAIPKLRAVTEDFAGERLLFGEYFQRGIEVQFLDDLKRQKALLLTGQWLSAQQVLPIFLFKR